MAAVNVAGGVAVVGIDLTGDAVGDEVLVSSCGKLAIAHSMLQQYQQ